jgi:vesicle coat complex subunit
MTVFPVTISPSEVGKLAKTSHHKIVACIDAVFDEVQPPAWPIWIDVENCCNRHHHNCVTYTETDVEKLHVY